MSDGKVHAYRQTPVVVEAIQYRPDIPNCMAVTSFLGQPGGCDDPEPHDQEPWCVGDVATGGDTWAESGDYIVRDGDSVYVMAADLFEQKFTEE